jgi:spore coat protein H
MGPPSGGNPGTGGGHQISDPDYFPVTLEYDGDTWEHVGMRYKGNSSLNSSWPSGNHKLPFRLDFDEFEDDYPEIDDQRFWGFKKLTFANNFRDDSFLREKICGDIFREAGVPTAESAFYRIYVDIGDGPTYWGLYTMVEDPSNTLLDSQFSDDDGNLYKPEGSGADWTTFTEGGFEKKTNEEEADWSDIIAAIEALHANGISEEDWRAGLEATFNVDIFLRWLAIHVMQQNWDAYGRSPHNYYIYGDPSDNGRLTWIPWDLNEAMTDTTSNSTPLTIPLDTVSDNAPLIRYLIDDPVYSAQYRDELQAAIDGAYALDPLHQKMERLHTMITPYVVGEEGELEGYGSLHSENDFTQSLRGGPDALIDLSESRHEAVHAYLDSF